ncbi:unnamed protein product [Moneuplotes crassus]|uniref:Uncharacterized protein n=1 Tax=Euplotes crassus TaxID=5936 RepID=A0AAD1U553_EUPCR|nr:unnamed protein product [Moneuplotes crassus]
MLYECNHSFISTLTKNLDFLTQNIDLKSTLSSLPTPPPHPLPGHYTTITQTLLLLRLTHFQTSLFPQIPHPTSPSQTLSKLIHTLKLLSPFHLLSLLQTSPDQSCLLHLFSSDYSYFQIIRDHAPLIYTSHLGNICDEQKEIDAEGILNRLKFMKVLDSKEIGVCFVAVLSSVQAGFVMQERYETEAKLVEDYVLQRCSEIIENDKEESIIFFDQDSNLLKDIMLALGNKSLAKKFEKRFCSSDQTVFFDNLKVTDDEQISEDSSSQDPTPNFLSPEEQALIWRNLQIK